MKNKTLPLMLSLFLGLSSYAQEGWFWQNPLPQGNALHGVCVFNQNKAIAVGASGIVLKTEDGGNVWDVQYAIENTASHFWSIQFANQQIGWVVGEAGLILKTVDGGESWANQSVQTLS